MIKPLLRRSTLGLVSAALVACGGGLLAALPFVGPIGGFWSDTTGAHTLDFDGDTDYYQGDRLTRGATLTSATPQCGDASAGLVLTAVLEDERFTLSAPGRPDCLRGEFLDELTLRLETGGTGVQMRNQRGFDPLFELGVWVNARNSDQRLVFVLPVTDNAGTRTQAGCEYRGTQRVGSVQVTFVPGNATTGARASVGPLVLTRDNGITEVWTDGRFAGASVLELASPSALSLQRRNLTLACP